MKKLIKFLFGKMIQKEAALLNKETGLKNFKAALESNTLSCKVFVVSDTPSNNFYEDLGLYEEDMKRLTKHIEAALRSCKTFSMAIEKVSAKCRNNQELAYISYKIGNLASDQAHMMQGNHPLQDLLTMDGSTKEKLEILAQRLGVSKEEVFRMYEEFLKRGGPNPGL